MGTKIDRLFRLCSFTCIAILAYAAEGSTLVKIFLVEKGSAPIIGELREETDTTVVVYDIQASKVRELTPESMREIRREISEQAAADRVELPRFLAWKIQKTIPLKAAVGKIATVDFATVYLNVGRNDGLEAGQELTVYRGSENVSSNCLIT